MGHVTNGTDVESRLFVKDSCDGVVQWLCVHVSC